MLKIRKIRAVGVAMLLSLPAVSVSAMDDSEMILQRDKKGLRFETAPAKEQTTAAAATPDTASALRVAGLWLVLIGAAGAALVYVKKRQKLTAAQSALVARMSLIERLPLGPNRELLLVKACDRLLVVSSLANQMSLLSDLPTEESASQPFAGVLKDREQKVDVSTRELREAPPARVALENHLKAQIEAARQPREPRRRAPQGPPVAAVPAWPEMENA